MPILYQTVRGTYLIRNGAAYGISPQDVTVVNTFHASTFISTGASGMPAQQSRSHKGFNSSDKTGDMEDVFLSDQDRTYIEEVEEDGSHDDEEDRRYCIGDENTRIQDETVRNNFEAYEPEDQFWKFDSHFNSQRTGKAKCSLCPKMIDEREGTCEECLMRVNKVKNIFSSVQKISDPNARREEAENYNSDLDEPQSDPLCTNETPNCQPPVLCKQEVPENRTDERQESVGDYYDSDEEDEQEEAPSTPAKLDNQSVPQRSPQGTQVAEQSAVALAAKNSAKQSPSKTAAFSQGKIPKDSSNTKTPSAVKGERISPDSQQTAKKETPKPQVGEAKADGAADKTAAKGREPGKPQARTGREIAVFKCPLCVKVFCQPPVLDYHLYKFHPGSYPFKCKDCKEKTFAYWKTYVIHRHIHKKPNTFMCESCAEDFGKDESKYIAHLKCHGLPTWKCRYCSTEFPSPQKLDAHFVENHGDKSPLTCTRKECLKSFTSSALLRAHLKSAHQIDEPDDTISTPALFPKPNTPVDVYTEVVVKIPCEICGVKQETIAELEKHMKSLHENISTVICHKCTKLVNINTMNSHVCKIENTKKNFKCGICSKQFTDINQLVSHQTEHQTVMRACDKRQTAEVTKSSPKLQSPKKVIQPPQPPSKTVEKQTSDKENQSPARGEKRKQFNDERRSSSPERSNVKMMKKDEEDLSVSLPNSCPLCPRKCSPGELQPFIELHNKAHRLRNPYPCPVPTCGKRFTESHYAYSHYRFVHRAVKDFILRQQERIAC